MLSVPSGYLMSLQLPVSTLCRRLQLSASLLPVVYCLDVPQLPVIYCILIIFLEGLTLHKPLSTSSMSQ